MANHTTSKTIKFQNEYITPEKFNEFLTVLQKVDEKEYNDEAKDGFVDLYNYWNEAGYRRFSIKLNQNKSKLKKP